MPVIEVSAIVKQDKKKVYGLLKNIEQFPMFMKNVKKIEVKKRLPDKLITAWNIEIDGANVIWEEEDIFDDRNMSIEFKMLRGDYKDYFGKWILAESTNNSTQIIISANFDWGIPVLGKYVGHVLERKARASLKSMLRAIQNQARNSER